MRRAVLVVAVLVLAGCGSGQRTIPVSAVGDIVRDAGFADVHHMTGPKAPSPSAFAAAAHEAGDLVYVGPFRVPPLLPLSVLWTESPALAAQRFDGDRPLRRGSYEPGTVPAGFESARLHETLICNTVVSSYNASGDGELERRYQRVVDLLQAACR